MNENIGKPYYTYVSIVWADEREIPAYPVIVKSTNDQDPLDDKIFFYGLTRRELIATMRDNTPIEDFYVVDVGPSVEVIE